MNANRHRIVTLNCGLGRDSVTMVCLAIERKLRCGDLGTGCTAEARQAARVAEAEMAAVR